LLLTGQAAGEDIGEGSEVFMFLSQRGDRCPCGEGNRTLLLKSP
jgi:hypothetical protein